MLLLGDGLDGLEVLLVGQVAGEIGLKVGEYGEYFGVINIGDTSGLLKNCEQKGIIVSNEEFVNRLYLTFMDREADTDGLNFWVDILNKGATRQEVVYGFTRSPEFEQKCIESRILPC